MLLRYNNFDKHMTSLAKLLARFVNYRFPGIQDSISIRLILRLPEIL